MMKLKYIKIFESFNSRLIKSTAEECEKKSENFGFDNFTKNEEEKISSAIEEGSMISLGEVQKYPIRSTQSVVGDIVLYEKRFKMSIDKSNTDRMDWRIRVLKLTDEWFIIIEDPITVKGRQNFYIADGFDTLLDYISTTEIRGYQPYTKGCSLNESFESELKNVSRDEFNKKHKDFHVDYFTQNELDKIKSIIDKNKGIKNITTLKVEHTLRNITFGTFGVTEDYFDKPNWSVIVHKLEDEWYTIQEIPERVFGLRIFYIIDGFEDLLKYLSYINEEEIVKKQRKLRDSRISTNE